LGYLPQQGEVNRLKGYEAELKAMKEAKRIPKLRASSNNSAEYPMWYEATVEYAEILREFGLEVEHIPEEDKILSTRYITTRDFDFGIWHFGPAAWRLDPEYFTYTQYHSSTAAPGGANLSGYSNPAYDKLTELADASLDPEKRKNIVWMLEEILNKERPMGYILHTNIMFPWNSRDFKDPTGSMEAHVDGPASFLATIYIEPSGDRKIFKNGTIQDFWGLNPVAGVGHTEEIRLFQEIYDSLFRVGFDKAPIPWAAKSYEILSDTELEFTLRDGMKFHDGEPVTAEDVAFTMDYLVKWKAPYLTTLITAVESTEARTERVVGMKLKRPYAPLIFNLCNVPILPKHIWETIPDSVGLTDAKLWENPKCIGSGPFKFEYWRHGEELMLTAFKEHFTPPKVDGTLWVVYGNMDALVGAAERAEVDGIPRYLTPTQYEHLKEFSHITVKPLRSHACLAAIYNTRIRPFSDVTFRKAMSLLIPRTRFIADIYGGLAEPAVSSIAPAMGVWYNPNLTPDAYNPDEARRILLEAGYTWDETGRLCYP
jgi:peptide/nickel transport system substrate-binding protein